MWEDVYLCYMHNNLTCVMTWFCIGLWGVKFGFWDECWCYVFGWHLGLFFGLFSDYGYMMMMIFSSRGSVMASISKLKQNNFVTISVRVTVCDHKNINLIGNYPIFAPVIIDEIIQSNENHQPWMLHWNIGPQEHGNCVHNWSLLFRSIFNDFSSIFAWVRKGDTIRF